MTKKNTIYLFLSLIFLSACKVGPNYETPELELPEQYRFAVDPVDTVINLEWWNLFQDERLVQLIDSALQNNQDVRMAASKIEEARKYLGYTKADLYPSLGYAGGIGYGNALNGMPTGAGTSTYLTATANISWEIDFWGKYRRYTEAAQADLLASEYGLRNVQISLITNVADAYYTLLDFNNRLEIAEQTLESRHASLQIIQDRFNEGTVPELDLNQAQIQEAIAEASIPVYKRQIAFTENALSLLCGTNPHAIATESTLDAQNFELDIPYGLPSQLLERRPDILLAEQNVIAQNAKIGVAQAMRFPSISLTGFAGVATLDLSTFNSDDALIGGIGGDLFGPIFNFGKNKRRVEMEKERTEQTKLAYEKVVLNAFRETEDALITLQTLGEEYLSAEKQLTAARNAATLSRSRYDNGVASYLEVLEMERSLFDIELYFSDLQRQQLSAYTALYKVLGGGWSEKK